MASSSFEYPPLDKTKSQIRLFEILPQPDSSLRYSLTTSDVSSCPNYIALSYVWGDDEPSNTIVINGQDFKIRDNLSYALPRLADFQSKRDEKHFWIDAICINQEDTKERNHQVGIMKDIFTKASLTVAWLGVDEETSRLLSQAEQTLFPERDLVSDLLERLACNDYFQRMWIVQEMILSPKLSFLYDDAVCPWARMERHWFRVRGYDGLNGDKFAAASLASKGIGEAKFPFSSDDIQSTITFLS
ncbi:hypothetical protein G7054_g8799 [Neopestalotiopsis clavispora]|nr:hypothetical protein G7054_g8799 [Neopestalotiopsis clavispora]